MPSQYYFGKKPQSENKLLRKILIVAGLIAILTTVVVLTFFYQYNREMDEISRQFEQNLETQNYQAALASYRAIQERKIATGSMDTNTKEAKLLASMENIVENRVKVIENKIRNERYVPDAMDRVFLEQMGEVTGTLLSKWMNNLCLEFIQGEIERPTLQFIFDQISSLSNVAAAAEPLQKQLDDMEIVSGDIQAAENLLLEEEYIDAVNKYQSVFSTYEDNSIISTYADSRINEIKKIMYQPMVDYCSELIASFRYYSAENVLSDMVQIFPNDHTVQNLLLEATENTAHVVPYPYTESEYPIEVIAVRPLITDKKLAFSEENIQHTNANYITTDEFAAMLQALYDEQYILIDVRILADMRSPTELKPNSIELPEGKKPVIIILENLNYSPRSYGLGFCRRLVLNDKGQVCGEYINQEGKTIVEREAEAIGILDAFVEAHPDFSFDGARGMVSLTGYEVTMGYLVHENQLGEYNTNAENAGALTQLPTKDELEKNAQTMGEIIQKMKDTGWVIASSSYKYLNMNSLTMEGIQDDTEKWLDQIGSITGETSVLIYPHGDFINGTDDRCVYLKENGFRIFFGIDPLHSNLVFGTNNLYMDRILLTGAGLRETNLSRLFGEDAKIYDKDRPA